MNVIALPLRRPSLGQVRVRSGRVVVVDASDRPVSGAKVSVSWQGSSEPGVGGTTDGKGIFQFSLADLPDEMPLKVTVHDGDYAVASSFPASQVETGVFVKIPVCLGQPLITGIEAGALIVGLGLTFVGMYTEAKPAELVGEVLFGAAAFTVIYRLSCM